MPLVPADPLSLVGLGLIGATIAVLLLSDWPRAYVLGISTIVLYGLQIVVRFSQPNAIGLGELALSTDRLLAGSWWTPVSYMFLHAGLFHIFGNLFILLTAGPALEESVGPRWFLIIYTLGGLAAAGAGVGLSIVAPDIVATGVNMVGASGAIFGVLTAFAIRHPKEKLPFILIFIVVWLPAMTVLLIYLVMNVAYMFTETSIAWYGHFAGFLAGLALASLPVLKTADDQAPSQQVPVEALDHLATSKASEEAVDHLRDLDPGEDDVAHAWLDVLAREAACPVCGSDLHRDDLTLVCQEGHDMADVGDPRA